MSTKVGKASSAAQTQERLLSVGLHILRAQGPSALTLDSVAKEAGVSKGGLLHHFPSKDALINGLVGQVIDEFKTAVENHHAQEVARNTPSVGRWLRAYVRASFESEMLPIEISAALLWTLSRQASLRQLLEDDLVLWQARLASDGIPLVRATIIRQAADMAWMERMMIATPPDERNAVMEELLAMTWSDAR